MQTNKNQFAIIERIKREGSPLYNLFPISQRTKYPIFFDKLLERINTLKSTYNVQGTFHVYENAELSRKAINKDLVNKGGIYIWWCSITGLFYIGSSKSFVGRNGRLNEYFQESRLKLISKTKISSNLAMDMLKYPKKYWNLIILEALEDLDFGTLREKEQFWMLLIPTYNRSFVIGSNEGLPVPEERRQFMSTLIYIYEISKEGRLVPNSEQKIFGIKNLARMGTQRAPESGGTPSRIRVVSTDQAVNAITAVNVWDIQAHLKSGIPFKDRFIFTQTPLTLKEQLDWKLPVDEKALGVTVSSLDKRDHAVWVYDFETLKFMALHEVKISSGYTMCNRNLARIF